MERHKQLVLELQKKLQSRQKAQICLAKTNSNTTRNLRYNKSGPRLDISGLDRVLEVDVANRVCRVEPRVSMYQLVKETQKYGLVPPVVPEFKGITVGGAINGCGGESSSHALGLFHDSCTSYEVLLGNGEVVWASAEQHSDLFHALHGSYGSLGVVLSATVRLVPASPTVALSYRHFNSPREAISYIRSKPDAPFIDGIIFSPTQAVVMEGRYAMSSKAPLVTPFSPWFCDEEKQPASLSLTDYLFRYDRGAFWMGAYLLRPPIFRRFLLEALLGWNKKSSPWFSETQIAEYSRIKLPGGFLRALSHPFMGSKLLFRMLHAGESWVHERFIIQDFTMPERSVDDLVEYILAECPVFPLWLCPVNAGNAKQLFSPNVGSHSNDFYINVGIYGIPNSGKPPLELLKGLEDKVQELSGRKWLYTNSTYTKEQFWEIYPKDAYESLRKAYYANDCWMEIDDKVLV